MKPNDLEPFGAMLALVAEQYGKAMSPELTRFYFDGLAHLPLEAVRIALNLHTRNTDIGQFMPKIADAIRAVEGTTEDAAYIALGQIQNDFSGANCTDQIARRVIEEMGGWRTLHIHQNDQ